VVQEQKPLRCDILVPDDVVVLLDNSVKTVARAVHPTDPLQTYQYRLLALRPADLESPDKAREKIRFAITAIESGTFDAMFVNAARLQHPQVISAQGQAISLREHSLTHLRQLLEDQASLTNVLREGKRAVDADRVIGVHATDEAQIEQVAAYLSRSNSPITAQMDRLFTAERVPIMLHDNANSAAMRRVPGQDGPLRKDVGAHIYLSPILPNAASRDYHILSLQFNTVLFDELTSKQLGILRDEDITRASGTELSRVRYYLDRKRQDIGRYNKSSGKLIAMFPDSLEMAKRKAQSTSAARNTVNYDDATATFAEAHHLLTFYQDQADQSRIRDRFDTVVEFHDKAMQELDRRIDERLRGAVLPPPIPPQAIASTEVDTGQPLDAAEAIRRANSFATKQLPSHYKLRSYLVPTKDHRIVIKLTNDAGDTVERPIKISQPNAETALDIKRRVQAHLLDMPGIVPYRGPRKEGSYHVNLDELIPASAERHRISPRYGEYRLKIDWRDRNEEISIPLGVQYAAENRDEANERAQFVLRQLANARLENPERSHLPLTKRDLIDQLREHVQQRGGQWDERTHGEIDGFPVALRFPFSRPGMQQESWLQIDDLKTDGDPNYTWVLPVNVVVNGTRLANASTHINLHVRDRKTAEERAIGAVNHMMRTVSNLPANAEWAIDPERPNYLLDLTEAARNAAPHLIDTNRLTDIQNELRSPFQKDLRVQLVGEPVVADGMQTFTLGIARGGDQGLAEPVLANTGRGEPPSSVQRRFSVPVSRASDIPAFADAVNRTFREVISEEYDPRSSLNYDAENLRKLKTPRPFRPSFAPNVLDRAIDTHLPNHPEMTALDVHASRVQRVTGGRDARRP